MLGFVKKATARVSYALLRRVPLPAEYKWRGTEELFAYAMQATLRTIHAEGALYAGAFGKMLDETGHAWMSARSAWVRDSPVPVQASAELLNMVLRTLDMLGTIHVSGQTIEAVTYRCPFVEHALSAGAARETCQHVCGSQRSLFTGFARALPMDTEYSAPSKMGWGDPQCVKHFSVRIVAGPDRDTPPNHVSHPAPQSERTPSAPHAGVPASSAWRDSGRLV